jgi:hypothetical protein
MQRRQFVKNSLVSGVSLLSIPLLCGNNNAQTKGIGYRLSLQSPTKLYDGRLCWLHPRVGLVPGMGENGQVRVVMTMNTHEEDDVFKGMFGMYSDDLGKTWTKPAAVPSLNPVWEDIKGKRCPVAASDFWPHYHRSSGKLLGTGHTVVYTPDWQIESIRPRDTSYSVYDKSSGSWSVWKKLAMPDKSKFYSAGAGCTQRYDLNDGDILLPVYFTPPGKSSSEVTVVKCSFDGKELTYIEHGDEIRVVDDSRGLHEPSLTYFNGWYYLTIRNDRTAFVTRGRDGLHYEPIRQWTFDNGSELGNYNTQQHWVTHSDGLFLVYTRKDADNDHIFRHRAPLFMAEVDPVNLCVLRNTERVIIPERGAALGNFGIVDVSERETWVTDAEFVYHKESLDYGSDGSVWIAKILWDRPNRLFKLS